jgi:Activator of Hsp90 ATPase homolog 1-like protein
MVSDADPAMRTGFDGRFTEVVENVLLASSGAWDGIPGHVDRWPSNLRVEFHEAAGKTRAVLREGSHPEGTADLGRQAWETMFSKLDYTLHD